MLTAIVWAVAVILFKRSGETVHPIGLNFFKNCLSGILLLITMMIVGETLFRVAPAWEYGLLLFSGALGIGVGDTLFFKSLNNLGAGLSAIVICFYSPVIIGLSLIFLGESLSFWQVVGALTIVSAVLIASLERNSNGLDRTTIIKGVAYGAAAQLANGIGIVMIKPLLDRSPLLWVTEVRVIGGTIVLALVLLLHRRRRAIMASVFSRQRWAYTLSGSFTGAYVAMMLWLAGMKFTQASTASALNQTSNVFIFILAWLVLKEPMSKIRIIGIAAAVGGALMVTFG
jgi:drug/metabolite transporter (DMT)-like permease